MATKRTAPAGIAAEQPALARTIARAAESPRDLAAGRRPRPPAAVTPPRLFTGAPGSGRSHAALALAAALECEDPDEPGCGRCRGCRAVLGGAHTDVVRVAPDGLSIGVDVARDEITAHAHRLPTVGRWRVVIVEEADRLSAAAADALLKTVEEPPERTVLIFLAPSTDPEDFSTTLRSRCRHVYVPPPSLERLERILIEEEGASQADARLAAAASLRHVGRARLLVRDRSMQTRRAQVLNLAELVNHGDAAFRAVNQLVRSVDKEATDAHAEADARERAKLEESLGRGGKGRGVAKALRGSAGAIRELEKAQKMRHTRRKRDLLDLSLVDLAGIYRDALMKRSGADVAPTHPDFAPLAEELAENVSAAGLVACLDAVATCRRHIAENVQFAIATDALVGRLRLAYQAR